MSDAGRDPAIVAVKACGCLGGAAVDLPQYRDAHAEEVERWIRSGLTVKHVTVEEARALPWARGGGVCDHDKQRLADLRGAESAT